MSSNSGLGQSALVTGASRGIGLTFIQHLCQIPDLQHIFACCRNPDKAVELQELKKAHLNLHIIQLDVENDRTIQSAYEDVSKILGDAPLNLLINNAGRFDLDGVTIEAPDRGNFLAHFNTNAVSHVIVTSIFLPLLQKAAKNQERALVVNNSSYMASIEYSKIPPKELGENIVYGMSKAAQNRFTRSFGRKYAQEGIIAIAINPGSVNTVMNPGGNVNVDDSVADMLKTAGNLKIEDSGKFLDRFGQPLPF